MNCELNSFKLGITFDDGYLDNLELVAPIMYERRIPFSVFITTDFLKKDARFMSPSQLVELSKFPNVSIGSHGKTHKSLTECSPSEVKKELFDSKAYLEDLLGKNIEMLAYPHGSVNLSVKQQAELAGYKKGFTTKLCINKQGVDPMMIGRCNIESDNTVRILSQKIYGDWDWYQFRSSAFFSSIRI
jgi:peptidoglycan/xylan/chitin deacetylase (PgdA/CDA1 family)